MANQINLSKTETHFVITKSNPTVPPPLYFDGQEVNEVKSHKHLVVLFSSALSWNAFSKIFTFLSCSCANTFCLYSALLIL